METTSKTCGCGSKRKIFCNKCSKIQMSILLKNGNDHLKSTNNRGHLCCPVWYSHLKQNSKPERDIIEGMLRRFFDSSLVSCTNKLEFYENGTAQKLYTHQL